VRPLDWVRSIRVKLGIVIVGAVFATTVVIFYGWRVTDLRPAFRILLVAVVGLVVIQVLAHGMTSPLRQMVAAARAMASGDYSREVRATSRDEVGELARAFTTMASQLAEVDRQRRDLIANVSHELRTPISGLQARLENLVDGVEEPDPDTLASMLRSVERLGRLVSQLLDLSRLESGAVPLVRRSFAVGPLLEDAADETRRSAAAAGRQVDVVVSVQDGLSADGDPERIHQVVANLLENAARHAPDGTAVEARAVRGDAPGAVTIEVIDAGPGIAPADAERVFERFYRTDAARATADGGSGLGLAIARWIVDLHGGTIRLHPNRPTGCRMRVELPPA
jgi:signal transduction histidine kinase